MKSRTIPAAKTLASRVAAGTQPLPSCLYMWFPVRMERALLPFLEEQGIEWEMTPEQNGLRLLITDHRLGPAVLGLAERLSIEEAQATKALRLEAPREPAIADLSKVTSLRQLTLLYRSRWLQDLMIRDRLTCHFQPIVEVNDTARIVGYESLLRGLGPDGALIPPLSIIGAARETRLLVQVNQHAQRVAVREIVRLGIDQPVFLNFNPSPGPDPFLALRATCRLADDFGFDRSRIVFEIVESDAIEDLPTFRLMLEEFRREGFRFALDDVGAGYSSLNLIHQLRPDFIKIDMALVRDVHVDEVKAMVTRKLIELARLLGIRTIAEGVEHREEFAWLKGRGVDCVQGFLIAEPASPPIRAIQALGQDALGASRLTPKP